MHTALRLHGAVVRLAWRNVDVVCTETGSDTCTKLKQKTSSKILMYLSLNVRSINFNPLWSFGVKLLYFKRTLHECKQSVVAAAG